MIQVGSVIIKVGVERWFLCVCGGCTDLFWTSVDPRLIESYRCPRCFCRIDAAPLHHLAGMVPAELPRVRLGDGLFLGLPAGLEAELMSRYGSEDRDE